MLVSIGEAAAVLGVSTSTLRRWEKQERLKAKARTLGGHRRYDIAEVLCVCGLVACNQRKTFLYARVSGSDQQDDLARQKQRLMDLASEKNWDAELVADTGSGLKINKRGLQHLLNEIAKGTVERIVLTHRDRLLRFGFELVKSICERFGTEIVVLDDPVAKTFEEELAADVVEIITVFCARMHGRRSHEKRKKSA